ncbi:MAG: indole-3-glycerol-phosphate synthase TrpC [Gammaproteobacteria bacterium]|nr:indole-3-glycerol-phosphate synthase TrpC [Gammaproteobacteria bacterium]
MAESGKRTGDFLAGMAASSHRRVAAARAQLDLPELLARAQDSPLPPRLQLSVRRFDLIAEVKFRSPASGKLRAGSEGNVMARVGGYAEAGAAAVSVLTEPSRFDGSMEHLVTAVRALGGRIPAMRKDFLVDPYQLAEARLAGAGGVLLILRMLDDATLGAMLESAARLKLFVLLESFDEADIAHAHVLVGQYASATQLLVGLNCRDLVSLEVVPGRLETLARSLPDEVPRVAESGVATAADAARVAIAGYDLALVGSALMAALEPLQLVRAMLSAGRTERARRS